MSDEPNPREVRLDALDPPSEDQRKKYESILQQARAGRSGSANKKLQKLNSLMSELDEAADAAGMDPPTVVGEPAPKGEEIAHFDEADDIPDSEATNPDYYMSYANTPADNPRARKEVEKRCKPIDFGMLVVDGTIRQEVPIHPEHLVVVFRTIPSDEKMYMDEVWSEETADKAPVVQGNSYALYQLALALVSINGRDLPPLKKDDKGNFVKETLYKKVAKLKPLPEDVVNVLSCNHAWFRDRVTRSMRVVEPLKNG